jgi:hypothetical protein
VLKTQHKLVFVQPTTTVTNSRTGLRGLSAWGPRHALGLQRKGFKTVFMSYFYFDLAVYQLFQGQRLHCGGVPKI